VTVANGYAYLADTSATRIIDVTTPSRPVIVNSIATVNAQAVTVTGTRLYMLDGGLLELFDISTAAPVLLGAATSVPGGSLHVAAAGTVAYLVNPNMVYTGSSPQGGLYVLDFSVPASPSMLANVRVTYDDRAAAAAGSLAAAGGMGKLTFLDISTPSAPRALSALSGTAQGVAMAGQFAYPLFIIPGNPAHAELDVVDLTVPITPTIVGRLAFAGSGAGVAVAGSLAYVASNGLQVVDVSSPTAPRVVGSLPTTTGSQGVAVANGYAYLADTSATEIIDVSTPSRPVLVSSIATVNAQSVAVVGSRLYVLDGGLLKIFSVATASAPLQLGTATTYGALSVAVTGSTVFLAAPAVSHVSPPGDVGGIYVLDASVASAPRLLKHVSVPGRTHAVATAGTAAFAADTAGIVDVIGMAP